MQMTEIITRPRYIGVLLLMVFPQLHARQYDWSRVIDPTDLPTTDIEFVDSFNGRMGVINGDLNSAILHVNEGGYLWQPQATLLPWNAQSISFMGGYQSSFVGALGYDKDLIRGSDTVNWRLSYPPELQPDPDDKFWANQFGPAGVHGRVDVIIMNGSDIYVGGDFITPGDEAVKYIAKWDGRSWSALGEGVNAPVYALAVNGSDIYAGGAFTRAGDQPTRYIAKWDGASWSTLKGGVAEYGTVYAIAVSGSVVYVGGEFYRMGDLERSYIAKWDGTNWSTLGSGVNNRVFAIAIHRSGVYVGGHFTMAGSVIANHIAKWDGSTWTALGKGMGLDPSNPLIPPSVNAIIVGEDNEVYAGGLFNTADSVNARFIAKWDGMKWSEIGGGVNGSISALAKTGNNLYAAGVFSKANNVETSPIAKWDGVVWSALGEGINSVNRAALVSSVVATDNGEIIAGGDFMRAGPAIAHNIGRWNETRRSWSALTSDINEGIGGYAGVSTVHAIAVKETEVYVGGFFHSAGNIPVRNIAKWDGTGWSALGSGVAGPVHAIVAKGPDIYVGGVFETAGGVTVNNVARWDGNDWLALDGGVSGGVQALAIAGDDVFVGGYFTSAGGLSANGIAKWNSSIKQWAPLGSGISKPDIQGALPNVFAIAVSGSEVYIGGNFTMAGDKLVNFIAKWDGHAWFALGSGLGGYFPYVFAIAENGNDIYAGGQFTLAGGDSVNHIAKWNISTNTWSALNNGISKGVNHIVNSIVIDNQDVYACGYFTSAGGLRVNRVARWSQDNWSALGNGADDWAHALAVGKSQEIYLGGDFLRAGGKLSYHFAKWNKPSTAVKEKTLQTKSFILHQNYPNPFNPATIIRYEIPQAGLVELAIYNTLGEKVYSFPAIHQAAGRHEVVWEGRNSFGQKPASGVYVYRLQSGGNSQVRKMILLR